MKSWGPLKSGRIMWIVVAVGIVFILVMGRVASNKKKADESAEVVASVEKPVAVRATAVTLRTVTNYLNLPGRLEPVDIVDLPVSKPGEVTGVNVDEGDRIKAGDLLAWVDKESWQHVLDVALIEEVDANKKWKQWQELAAVGAVSSNDYDNAGLRAERARVAAASARADVRKCEVRSTIDGVVEFRALDKGEYAREGDTLFRVVSTDSLKLTVDVPERDVASIKKGDSITFTILSLGGHVFSGIASFVAFHADPHSNTYRVEADVANEQGLLRGGMLADTRLVRSVTEDAVVVPAAAVVPDKGDNVVFVVSEDGTHVERAIVQVSDMFDTSAVIASGLTAGQSVITEGQRRMMDGMAIAIESSSVSEVEK